MDAQAYLADRGRLVDAALDRSVPAVGAEPGALHAAMRHLLFPGGKRLRPALAFAGAEAVGAAPERALPVAVAVELIHTYSLVHDDLPCMDDDAERRGRPTVHVAYGEAAAVLAGDALLALAFESLATAAEPTGPFGRPHEPARLLAALRELAEAAGSRQLVGGQYEDLHLDLVLARVEDDPWAHAGSDLGARAQQIESVQRRKSAALIRAAVVGGARLGGAAPDALARLTRFGWSVGVAFQISDDLLDESDTLRDGASLVRAIGAPAARARAERLLEEGLAGLEPFGAPAEPLRELARFAVWRDR